VITPSGKRESYVRTTAEAAIESLREQGGRLAATFARDIEAVRERDPAARSTIEIVSCYPGLHALWLHRAAHALPEDPASLSPRRPASRMASAPRIGR